MGFHRTSRRRPRPEERSPVAHDPRRRPRVGLGTAWAGADQYAVSDRSGWWNPYRVDASARPPRSRWHHETKSSPAPCGSSGSATTACSTTAGWWSCTVTPTSSSASSIPRPAGLTIWCCRTPTGNRRCRTGTMSWESPAARCPERRRQSRPANRRLRDTATRRRRPARRRVPAAPVLRDLRRTGRP